VRCIVASNVPKPVTTTTPVPSSPSTGNLLSTSAKRKALGEMNNNQQHSLDSDSSLSPTKKARKPIDDAPSTPQKQAAKPAQLVRGLSELANKGKTLINSRRQSLMGLASRSAETSTPTSSSRRQSISNHGRV